jgi:hypothetical protein
MLLHQLSDFDDLIQVTARELRIDPSLVEKDYWIMHGLWGLQQLGMTFQLKGGTSLSKGYRLIHRFSEDIDILIEPDSDVPTGRNKNKKAHIEQRRAFYDGLVPKLKIDGLEQVDRDEAFDDEKLRSAGIRLRYTSKLTFPEGIKEGILLEAGFDQVAPNKPMLISSWAYDKAAQSGVEITDNRPHDVPCYDPGYTLVEKLQTISTKYRRQQEGGDMPQNFMRHYYDIYCLLGDNGVQRFIGTEAYHQHKRKRFPKADNKDIGANPAFRLGNSDTRALYERAYAGTAALYYQGQPDFGDILGRIKDNFERL